ncbi:MAG: RNA polymerase subunit sigma-24, partial [Spirosomataceae bacterium]
YKVIYVIAEGNDSELIIDNFKYSFQEIAEATGVSINTALGRMRYALINLRKMMSKSVYAYDTNLYTESK